MVTTYCAGCHSSQAKAGGLALDTLSLDAVGKDAQIWEKAVRKLRGGLMPPPGAKQPDQNEVDRLIGYLETKLDAKRLRFRRPATPKFSGLSRTEYIAAVKALVGVDVKSKDILPQDTTILGFDNIASGLGVSPTFVEQYVEAARVIAKQAVGDISLDDATYLAGANRGGEAMPLGFRDGGIRVKHNFSADGEYRFQMHFPDQTLGLYTANLENEATVVLLIDGKVVFKKADRWRRRFDVEQPKGRRRACADSGSVRQDTDSGSGRHSRSRGWVHGAFPISSPPPIWPAADWAAAPYSPVVAAYNPLPR